MLAVSSYSQEYIDSCRASVERQLAAYRSLVKGAKPPAIAKFATLFFANMVLVLDASFADRLRSKEGKDGNPLNEVRMLCGSLLQHDRVFTADKTIKLKPDQTVLHLEIGDPTC